MSAEVYNKPLPIRIGDEVALVSPVSLPPQQFRSDIAIMRYLREIKGLKPRNFIAENDTPVSRLAHFHSAIDSGQKVLLSVTGNRYGEDIVNEINYNLLEKSKPLFCTFSAASVLHHAIRERSKLVTFYGPHISFLYNLASPRENSFTNYSFWNMLSKQSESVGIEENLAKYIFKWDTNNLTLKNIFSSSLKPLDTGSEEICFVSEKTNQGSSLVQGKIIPSFLQSLEKAIDMGIKIDFNNKIVIVESDETSFNESLQIINRLKQSSNISTASALVLASFVTFKRNPPNLGLQAELYNSENVHNFVNNVRKLFNGSFPVIYGFPMGHLRYKLTVPSGVDAELNIETGEIKLKETPFSDTELI